SADVRVGAEVHRRLPRRGGPGVMTRIARRYHSARSAAGQLLVLGGTRRVAAGEWVRIVSPNQPDRRGQVIEASEQATVVHVQQEMIGFAPSSAGIVLTGEIARARVGRDL